MRAFLDTSSLFKKYVTERDFAKLDDILSEVSEITVSPITLLEMHSVIERKVREKSLSHAQALEVEKNMNADFDYFGVVVWNENLQITAKKLIRKYPLKVLDSLQLASGKLSEPAIFITSDKQLFKYAQDEVKRAVFID